MKRNLSNLDIIDLKNIRRWLNNDTSCPFPVRDDGTRNGCSWCLNLFPGIEAGTGVYYVSEETPVIEVGPVECPCIAYSEKYVRKVATKILKDLGYPSRRKGEE